MKYCIRISAKRREECRVKRASNYATAMLGMLSHSGHFNLVAIEIVRDRECN